MAFTEPTAIAQAGALDRLEAFVSHHGVGYDGLPRSTGNLACLGAVAGHVGCKAHTKFFMLIVVQ
jgi:hypothetical protein